MPLHQTLFATALFTPAALALGQSTTPDPRACGPRCAMIHPESLIAPFDHEARRRFRFAAGLDSLPQRQPVSPEPFLSPAGTPPPSGVCGDDGNTIDILFLATNLATTAAGGSAALQSRVTGALASCNSAYVNSGISVGTGAGRLTARAAAFDQITYDEVAPDWLDHLDRLATPGDGFLDQALVLRDQHRADVVCLIIDDTRFFGGAAFYALYVRDAAAIVINWRALANGDFTLAHELGHTFGCAHNRPNSSFALWPYAWGHTFSSSGTTFGTIMSTTPGSTLVPLFSNPFILHSSGQPVGVGLEHPLPAFNALAISHAKWTIANWADSTRITDCNGNGQDDTLDLAQGLSLDTNLNGRPDECETRIFVDANSTGPQDGLSWNSAFTSLSTVMLAASFPCSHIREIWVADGTYTPDLEPGDRFARFALRSGLTLIGGFQGRSRIGGGETSPDQRALGPDGLPAFSSTLSGEINTLADTDNSFNVLIAENCGPNAVLDGFVVERGYQDFSGAGIFISNASPTFRRCDFRLNRANFGAAVAVTAASHPTFDLCAFRTNTATGGGGAVLIDNGAAVTIDRSTFTSNSAAGSGGGAITAFSGASILVRDSTFTNNTGRWGGAIATADSSLSATRCAFHSNHAIVFNGGAVDLFQSPNSSALSCAFTANTAADVGGAVYLNSGSTLTLTNSTISGNSAQNAGGGIAIFNASLSAANAILYHNSSPQPSILDRQLTLFSGSRTVNRSCVQGLSGSLGGTGNIGANPLLADPAAGNVALSPGSPCIDAGSNALVPPGHDSDLLGNPRFIDDPSTPDTGVGPGPVVDIGAAEFVPGNPCPADFNNDGNLDPDDLGDFINCYFALPPCPGADFNADGSVDPDDLGDFINAYFAGC